MKFFKATIKRLGTKLFWLKFIRNLLLLLIVAIVSFKVLDWLKPLPIEKFEERTFAQLVVASNGEPLRAFPDQSGIWRYPVSIDEVSPLYLEALINYEDRYFYQHFGINPLSLIRASGQAIRHGRIISGASTLTMQVARIMEPHQKTFAGKLWQMFRALQLEWHYDKKEILTFYLNYAPFGGPIEGIEAASFTYLGKSAKELTHSEAALLAVLPQSPSRFRPDKYPLRAKKARNKLLDRLAIFDVWEQDLIEELKIENVWAEYHSRPMLAPLLAQRLKQKQAQQLIQTYIDTSIQVPLEMLVKDYILSKPNNLSAAVLVMDNETAQVKSYVASADFANKERAGYVDMIQAIRSPGSTLKPFIYGLAIDQGIIHSESLLFDIPQSFNGYQPQNFDEHFNGPVSVSQALSRSLNMPAVQVLNEISPELFVSELSNAGLSIKLPNNAKPNLSLALGGGGASLEQLVGLYRSLSSSGKAVQPKLTYNDQLVEKPLLTPGASWIIQNILSQAPLRNSVTSRYLMPDLKIAYKTGTSYGARDTWALATSKQVTIGVWVGSPDGSFSIGNSGRATAVPLLERVITQLDKSLLTPIPQPVNVDLATICWPLGTHASLQEKAHCHQKRRAYLLDGTAPPTLKDRLDKDWKSGLTSFLGNTFNTQCDNEDLIKGYALWPKSLEPWLAEPQRATSILPACLQTQGKSKLELVGLEDGMILFPEPRNLKIDEVQLQVEGTKGKNYWFLNGKLLKDKDQYDQKIIINDLGKGTYELTVIDQNANFTEIAFEVSL